MKMNQREATIAAIGVSLLTALVFGVPITIISALGMFSFDNLEQIYIAILRLDGVLFGFVLAVFAFSFKRIKADSFERDWGYVTLISIFISILGSIFFAFLGLLTGDQRSPSLSLFSISLTLGVIVSVIFWIQDLAFPHKANRPANTQ